MADSSKKRKAALDSKPSASNKRTKGKKQWRAPRTGGAAVIAQARSIEPGDAGIWATCDMRKEGKCVVELRDTFDEYARKLYGASHDDAAAEGGEAEQDEPGIEAEIQRELENMSKQTMEPLFTHIRLDTDCVVFFKTRPPVEPVSFVHAICAEAASSAERKQSRFVKRLTPMTVMGKATDKGLDEIIQQVLAPHFHGPDCSGKKFAIRPTFRNHKALTREGVIRKVAAAVGPGHKVDLKDYDLLILVEIYKNICGMSVVGADYERLKRYNLAEIYEPTPKINQTQ